MTTYLLLGSNLGDRSKNLQRARQGIREKIGRVITSSSVYMTKPWGKTDQPDFLNQVLEVSTSMEPGDILAGILQIEMDMGRIRAQEWDQRLIDIDILFYGDEVMNHPSLQIPHPRIQERRFTLVPLNEIAPQLLHPVSGKSIRQLLDECTDPLEVRPVTNS
jgi:2-amino-4-hydroxy-6-hydroxymethyldihydropteridine diphosphokinase